MQSALKTLLWILVVLVIAGGAYYWYQNAHPVAPATPATSEATSTDNGAPASLLASGSDTSDAGLSQDLTGIDTQMSTLNADTASIDSGLNDQPIPQQ